MLRAAGAPEDPPANLRDVARDAALGSADVVRLRPKFRMDNRLARLSLAAAVLLASSLAALVIGVGGNRMSVDRRISLDGAAAAPQASATVEFGSPHGAVRTVVVRVNDLAPAPKGGYYELWMQTGPRRPDRDGHLQHRIRWRHRRPHDDACDDDLESMLDHARVRGRRSLDGAANRLISPLPGRSLQSNYTQTGVARTPGRMPNETAVYPSPKRSRT